MCICALQNYVTIKLITTDDTINNNRLSGDDRMREIFLANVHVRYLSSSVRPSVVCRL